MKGNYSPYNRTFKFICLQNQLAHIKNKSSVRSLGKSNLSICNSPDKKWNPIGGKTQLYQSTRPNFNSFSVREDSGIGSRKGSYSFIQPYRVIHMNQSYDKKRKRQEYYENERLAMRLCNISCSVVTKQQTEKQFESHLNYKSIARKYGEDGSLKEMLRLNEQNSMTASKVEKSLKEGHQLCNVSRVDRYHFSSTKKKSSGKLIKQPKSNIIRLY